jgi:hypothetical protein
MCPTHLHIPYVRAPVTGSQFTKREQYVRVHTLLRISSIDRSALKTGGQWSMYVRTCTKSGPPDRGREHGVRSTYQLRYVRVAPRVAPLAIEQWPAHRSFESFFFPSFRPWHWTTTTHHTTPACPAALLPAQRVQRSSKNRHLISITTHSSAAASSIRYHARSLTSRARPPGQAHSYRFRPRRSRAGSHTRPRGSYQLAKQLGGAEDVSLGGPPRQCQ